MTVSADVARIARAACIALEVTAPASIEDDSDLARDLLDFYGDARDRCLEGADWSFASVLVHLPQMTPLSGTAVDADLPYTYAVPSDCRRILEVGDLDTRWRRDAIGIRADAAAPLRLRYTAASPKESLWPGEFRTAVALTLATMLAAKWLPVASKIEALERRAGAAMKQAMRNHAADASAARYDGGPDEGDWLTEARR